MPTTPETSTLENLLYVVGCLSRFLKEDVFGGEVIPGPRPIVVTYPQVFVRGCRDDEGVKLYIGSAGTASICGPPIGDPRLRP